MSNVLSSLLMLASLITPSAFKQAHYFYTKPADIGEGSQELRLLNVEDYIYEMDPTEEGAKPNIVDQFVEYAKEKGYKNVKVSYETTDTPESMRNLVKLSPQSYDLVCPSEYMIQRMITNNMLEPMHIDEEHMPNYLQYACGIKNKLDAISATNATTGEVCYLKDYAVGYMWGTLGLLFDPEYGGRDMDTTVADAQSWDILWNPDYKGISSIKDSVRDTYAIGLLHALNDDFEEGGQTVEGFETLMNKHHDGTYSDDVYNAKFNDLFNKCDDATLNVVKKDLSKLKGNVFGMEVDSGKQDIVTGKIGINFAWSGDAVYSMEQAEEEKELELYYSSPDTGSNLWMDAWVMPKNPDRSQAQRELAELFVDFLSIPEYTSQNMSYTGYTPFTGGNEILDLAREWYDYRYDEETEEFDDTIPSNEEIAELCLQRVDLSYFFKGTLTDEYADDENAYIFYSDCYLPYAETDEEGNVIDGEESNRAVGREFFCQFPDSYTLSRCAVMRDFGSQNDAVLGMWEKFKSDALPVWAIILFVVEVSLGLALLLYFVIGKRVKTSLHKKRKQALNKK